MQVYGFESLSRHQKMKTLIDWLYETFIIVPLMWFGEWYAKKYIGECIDDDDDADKVE